MTHETILTNAILVLPDATAARHARACDGDAIADVQPGRSHARRRASTWTATT